MNNLPTATTDKKQDMSKAPFSSEQRFHLWLTFIIVSGVVSCALGITYLACRH